MTQTIAYRGRLPGVRCDPALPRRDDAAIRLDVAAFVGFAERGPVDDPQPMEDPLQYATVFGGDLQLAIDDHGVPVYAAMPDAVRAFFDNGGRRAYIVRVVGHGAATLDVPVRVTSRIPLGAGRAVTALSTGDDTVDDADGKPLLHLAAASPGRWAAGMSVDVDIVDTVLPLATGGDGVVDLTPDSRHLLDEGDTVLVQRVADDPAMPDVWQPLRVPKPPATVGPPDGWRGNDVARLLRATLSVRMADGLATVTVEQFDDLRFGPGSGRSTSWTDVLQPAGGGFRRSGSMCLRAPHATFLIPILGEDSTEVPSPATAVISPAGSRAALELDGLATFDPVQLFLDPSLTGHTTPGLRVALEMLGLDDEPHVHGLHAVARQPDVAIVAIPDLYQRPWSDQAALDEALPGAPSPEPTPEPPGFHQCSSDTPPPPTPPPAVVQPAVLRMVVDPPRAYDPAGLHAVAGGLADLCAARADMVAVLGLPRHAGLAEAQHLADVLAARRDATADIPSYVGVWHPWLAVAEQRSTALAPLRPVPPDGAVAGTIAASELTRGWWIEPAGRRLAGVLDVDPLDAPTTLALFDRGLNVVRRRPGGFAATSAHSLSADRTLLQLSVRRLLIWVRKLAMRDGIRFVFEPDSERFRDQVATTFRRSLEQLRLQGALAAYQVEIEPLATRTLADEGRLRIDLKIAPTLPIEFITITLLRTAAGALQVGGP